MTDFSNFSHSIRESLSPQSSEHLPIHCSGLLLIKGIEKIKKTEEKKNWAKITSYCYLGLLEDLISPFVGGVGGWLTELCFLDVLCKSISPCLDDMCTGGISGIDI